ncbi:hypothetical protein Cva_00299 [Caedimonas varicaedens]|uniref:Uncharacterized protein n=1 Tax=Caedimonas varicaedens TaxID=1629334 RepID=A0A0K8MBR9_9PROT|nr:hypothetical protein Cva_00299 [Caedimonas varicaedens]
MTKRHKSLNSLKNVDSEELILGTEDILLHLSDDEPVMMIQKEGSWNHLLGCVLAYVLERQDLFDSCLEAYLLDSSQGERELFLSVLRERGHHAH